MDRYLIDPTAESFIAADKAVKFQKIEMTINLLSGLYLS